MTQYFNFFPRYYKFDYFLELLDVDDQDEFKRNYDLLNNKYLSGFNFTKSQFNFFGSFNCEFMSDIIIFNGNISYDIRIKPNYKYVKFKICKFYKQPLMLLSPCGKCMTYSVVREKVSREIFLEIFREIFLANNFSEFFEKFLN